MTAAGAARAPEQVDTANSDDVRSGEHWPTAVARSVPGHVHATRRLPAPAEQTADAPSAGRVDRNRDRGRLRETEADQRAAAARPRRQADDRRRAAREPGAGAGARRAKPEVLRPSV